MVRRRRPATDGRANNGGVRQGQPGKPYPNRTDMQAQAVRTATGQPYGAAAAQQAAQQAVPLPQQPGPQQAAGPRYATAEDAPNLLDPTARPDEPLEAGLPFGPGPGPEALPMGPAVSDLSARLRALYSAFPTPELRELLQQMDIEGR